MTTDLASIRDQIIGMIGVTKDLTVPSTDLLDEDYCTGDILVDLKRLYARSKLCAELEALLVALRADVVFHAEDVNDRIKVLNRMLGQRLGAA